ncbi:MAG: MFS transporter [Anaerolineae bacterium]|nr:MFS transporter [Anaerolineae bacterium]
METTQKKKWQISFFSIWTGQQVSLIGSSAVRFVILWWLTQQTGKALVLTTAMIVMVVPQAVVSLVAGAYVDRWNRRLVMLVADAAVALASLWLAYLFWIGEVRVWHVYVAILVRSVGMAFHLPAMAASTSLMVPERHLTRVAGLNQTIAGLVNLIGQPVGALLMAFLPLHSAVLVDVWTALPAVLPLFFVRIPQPERVAEEPGVSKVSIWADVLEGMRYVRSWPGAPYLLGMALVVYFVLSPSAALPSLLVYKHFGGGAAEFSWFELAWGSGVLLGGLFLSAWGGFKRRIYTSLMGLFMLGVGFVLVGVAPPTAFWLALVGNFISGFMNSLTVGPISAVLQARVDPDMQGRMFTLISLSAAMGLVSLAIAGPVADAIGVQPWYFFGGLVCMSLGLGAFFVPAIVNVEKGLDPESLQRR